MPIIAKALKGAIWLFAHNWLSALLGLASSIVLARLLGPEAFGTVALGGIAFGAASLFIGASLTDSLRQREVITQAHIDTVFWVNTAIAAALALLITAVGSLIGAFFGSDTIAEIIPLMAVLAFISSLHAVPSALLERDLEYDKLVRVDGIAALPSIGVSIGLAYNGWGVWSLLLGPLTGTLLGGAALWYYARYRPGFHVSRSAFRELAAFNWNTFVLRVLDFADNGLPRLLLGIVGGEQAVGLLDLALKICGQLTDMVMGPFREMAMSVTARLQSSVEDIRRTLDGVYTLTTHLVYPATIGLCVLAPLVVPYIFGEVWIGAVPAAQIMLLSALRDATGDFNFAVLRGVGRTREPIMILSSGILILLVLAPVFMPYGVSGIASLIALRVWLTWPLSAKFVEAAIGYSALRQFTFGWRALLYACAMGGLVWSARDLLQNALPPGLAIAALIAIGAISYGTFIALFTRSKLQSFIDVAKRLRAESAHAS